MFTTIAFAALLAVLTQGTSATEADAQRFAAFKVKYGKTYATAQEEAKRFQVFVDNMRDAESQARANPLATFGVNEFSDRTAAEFKVYHNSNKAYAAARKISNTLPTMPAPKTLKTDKIDWRKKGVVTPVKHQGDCGSCWAFSTLGGIEGQWALAGHPLVSLSEQELVSCDPVDSACEGGIMDDAYRWLIANRSGTSVTAASYPYVSGIDGTVPKCDMTGRKFGATIDGYYLLKENDEPGMVKWVAEHGPLSIALDSRSWKGYSGGIMTNCAAVELDHGVVIVGFDLEHSPPYWIMKNSWGADWGDHGYIKIAYGSDQCMLAAYPTTATVAKDAPVPPPTPTAPTGPTFTQKKCTDAKCKSCTADVLPQKKCIKAPFGSYTAECATDALIVSEYTSSDCKGTATIASNPINQCSVVLGSASEFIMNECGAAPAPTPTPTPKPEPKTFTQMICQQPGCNLRKTGCANHTFPQGECLNLSGGMSAIATCTDDFLELKEFTTSSACEGPSVTDKTPVGQCLQGAAGTYFENFCSGTTGALLSAASVQKPSQ